MTRYLDRFKPRLLVPPGRQMPRPGGPPTQGPPRTAEVRLMALIWTTWDQSQPTDLTKLESSFTVKGYNWQIWEDALTTRILARGGTPANEIVTLSNQVQLKGEAVLDLASMQDVAFFGHWIPPNMVATIKARSTAPDGTRVYFWTDFESIGHQLPWNYQRQELWDALHNISPSPNPAASYIGDAVLLPYGSTVNPTTKYITGGENTTWGLPHIDKYESQAGPVACPHEASHGAPPYVNPPNSHTWDLDVYQLTGGGDHESAQAERCVNLYLGLLESYGYDNGTGTFWADGFAFDNLLEAPYKGAATNAYPDGWSARHQAGWAAFLRAFERLAKTSKLPDKLRYLWGNGAPGTTDPYSTEIARQRYVEHAFRTGTTASTLAEIQARLQAVQSSGQYAVLAFNGTIGSQWYWGTTSGGPTPATNGTWAQVVDEIERLGLLDRVYVATWQMLGTGSYAFWQEGFRQPS